MAGSQTRADQIVALNAEIAELSKERDLYHSIIVEHMPEMLTKDHKPTPIKRITKKVYDQMWLMGKAGKTEMQWIEAFGLTPQKWADFKAQHPEMQDHCTRALTAALSYYRDRVQTAMQNGNQKFPMGAYNKIVAEIEAELGVESGSGEGGAGDASKLVILDLRAEVPDAAA